MNLRDKYKSIGKINPSEVKDKGSKFIGLAAYVLSEEDVKQKLQEWKDQHPQATHLCYAYRLGLDGSVFRANDDGEPNNSAGAPILGQLISADLTNTLVGVVRYYGGTKLGVGGLIAAYKDAAKFVIEGSEIIEYQLKRYYKLALTYEDMPHIMAIIKRNRIEIVENRLTDKCNLVIQLEINDKHDIKELLSMYELVEIIDLGIK